MLYVKMFVWTADFYLLNKKIPPSKSTLSKHKRSISKNFATSKEIYGSITIFLPQSPHHKKELLLSLASDFGIECRVRQEIANGNKGLPQETVDKAKSYYLESSWTCPGRKDFVIVCENNKEKKQKHYLLTKLKEPYSIFCNENPNFHIGFLSFVTYDHNK